MSLNKKHMGRKSPVFCLQCELSVLHETVLWRTQPLGQQGSDRNRTLKEKVGQLMKVRERTWFLSSENSSSEGIAL